MKLKKKIVWLCPFANDEVAQILGITNQPMLAPWITELVTLFRKKDDVDLSILSPNYYSNTDIDFFIDDIHVFLFKYKPNYLPKFAYNLTINYLTSRRAINKWINEITPDIIHLFGSENPLYSVGFLELWRQYPILISLQGFVSLSPRPKNLISRYIRWNRIRIETKINRSGKYFTIVINETAQRIKKINLDAQFFQTSFPTTIPQVNAEEVLDKKYELVFYARVTKNKGVEDFIAAVHKLKDRIEDIKAIIIGGASDTYLKQLKQLVKSLDLEANIVFAGFQATQHDVFKLAIQADIYVLPSYFDGIPGTIREAMYMKLPVVAYNVGGIPSINEDVECITLVESRNIDDLVEKIWLVMTDKERTTRLVNNAYEQAVVKLNNNIIYDNFIRIYSKIIELENENN